MFVTILSRNRIAERTANGLPVCQTIIAAQMTARNDQRFAYPIPCTHNINRLKFGLGRYPNIFINIHTLAIRIVRNVGFLALWTFQTPNPSGQDITAEQCLHHILVFGAGHY